MREILFRGKHISAIRNNEHLDGRWVYGYLCDKNHIHSPELEGELLIDPETACQYTGKEKGGEKLFENDIVECRGNGRHFQTCIEWDGDVGGFMLQDTESTWCGIDALGDGGIYSDFRIIGNVFDNPELAEERMDEGSRKVPRR